LETHRCRGYVANFRVAVFGGKKRERRRATLENPKRPSLKKVCGSYARICARYPRWPGFPDETRKTIYWYDKRSDTLGAGFFSELFTHVGQWGTHVDPPAHLIKGLRTVDQIDPKEMILPLVIVDVHEEAAKNPDYTFSLERVKKWEKDHGQIPSGAFVAMRTDWSKRWPDAAKMEIRMRTASLIIRAGACPV